MIIGRHGEQPFLITDQKVSGKHCDVTDLGDGTFEIQDIGSKNGTFVNGTQIIKCQVSISDKIVLGGNYSLDLNKCFPKKVTPPPPSPVGVFPPHLRKIYEDKTNKEIEIATLAKRKQNIRMLLMSASSMIALLSYFGFDQETTKIITAIFSIAAFILLLTMLFGSDKTGKEVKELNKKFMLTYIDGNCNHFLGNFPPEYFENNLHCNCPSCHKKIK